MQKLTAGDAPEPFPLKSQYVRNMAAQAAAAAQEAEDGAQEPAEPVRGKRKAAVLDANGEKVWAYNDIRLDFIKKQRTENGKSFQEAKAIWDDSDEKRTILGAVSVKELRRRKFIPKDCQTNPWAQQ